MVFASMLFSIVPEGLAAAWAAELSTEGAARGINQGMIMAANPVGFILGGLLISRLVSPARRQMLVRPFAVLAPASLVPALLHPSAIGVALMAAVCGFSIAAMMPTANGLFVQALPHGFRGRAFGVMQSGLQIMQGVALLATGLLADVFELPDVVGVWSLAGVALMLLVSAGWPSPQRFARAIAAANRAGSAAGATPAGATPSGAAPAPSAPPPDAGRPPPSGPPPPWPPYQPVESHPAAAAGLADPPGLSEPASRAVRNNSGGPHRPGAWRPLPGHSTRDDAPGGALPNAGPRNGDDLSVPPTSPATGPKP
jgi:MFS family permease